MNIVPSLHIAYTPDSDDAFYYDALEAGQVTIPGYRLHFQRRPMAALNRAALYGRYEVTAISSVLYPRIADTYAILSVGTSVGRGYGPVLVSRQPCRLGDLLGKRVGVAGIPTTGWFLLRVLCPGALTVTLPFDEIGAAVARGDLDAGVMIHEELLYYPRLGLQRIADLGALWCEQQGLPLPVGLNVIRRDLGPAARERICGALRASVRFGLDHREETLGRVSRFGRGSAGQCTRQFVSMFANQDSLRLPGDVRTALGVLLTQVADLGLGPAVPALDIVEGMEAVAEGAPQGAVRSIS